LFARFILPCTPFLYRLVGAAQSKPISCKTIPVRLIGVDTSSKRVNAASLRQMTADASEALHAYRSLSGKQKEEQEKKLNNLLSKRKELLVQAMRNDTNVALLGFLPESLIQQASQAQVGDDCVEHEATVEGTLEVLHVDYDNGTSETAYYLDDANNKRLELHPRQDVSFQSGQHTPLVVAVFSYKG